MIGKIVKGRNFKGCISYVLGNKEASILASEGVLEADTKSYFNFSLFKVRKTSLVIAILGLLVFLLIVFCMKQQNDYALMANEYYKQMIAVELLKNEIKDLKNINEVNPGKKKK